jgi:uncharacterized cupin superfamily protein
MSNSPQFRAAESRVFLAARCGRPTECPSTTRRPLTPPNGRVSSRKTAIYVGTGGGTLLRIDEWAPGAARFTHRTETLDYIIMLSGEIDLELDSGEVAHLKSGDVLLNRGMIHTWVNKGSVPAVMAVIMIDAKPVEVNGKVLGTVFPSFPGQRKGDKIP